MTTFIKVAAAAAALFVSSAGSLQAAQLVMIDNRGCGYCAKFNREVAPSYNATAFGQIAPLRKVSPFKKWPADLAGVRPAPYTPFFILVDKGREIGRFAGYNGVQGFWRQLQPLVSRLR